MRTILVVLLVTFAAGIAAAASSPSKEAALAELNAAIREERAAIALLRATPPKPQTASLRLDRAAERLRLVADYASTVNAPVSLEQTLRQVAHRDLAIARNLRDLWKDDLGDLAAIIERMEKDKLAALEKLRASGVPAGTPQCSDGKDNDGDGITDWKQEPGCTSARDLRERSPFTCSLETGMTTGRLAVRGSCSGAFSSFEILLLDSQLNGRYEAKHAPACGTPTPTGFRCTAKDAAQNPGHLFDVRLTTTSRDASQRVRVRFFDVRKRQIAHVLLPVPVR